MHHHWYMYVYCVCWFFMWKLWLTYLVKINHIWQSALSSWQSAAKKIAQRVWNVAACCWFLRLTEWLTNWQYCHFVDRYVIPSKWPIFTHLAYIIFLDWNHKYQEVIWKMWWTIETALICRNYLKYRYVCGRTLILFVYLQVYCLIILLVVFK